jgi:hypothetical protein
MMDQVSDEEWWTRQHQAGRKLAAGGDGRGMKTWRGWRRECRSGFGSDVERQSVRGKLRTGDRSGTIVGCVVRTTQQQGVSDLVREAGELCELERTERPGTS